MSLNQSILELIQSQTPTETFLEHSLRLTNSLYGFITDENNKVICLSKSVMTDMTQDFKARYSDKLTPPISGISIPDLTKGDLYITDKTINCIFQPLGKKMEGFVQLSLDGRGTIGLSGKGVTNISNIDILRSFVSVYIVIQKQRETTKKYEEDQIKIIEELTSLTNAKDLFLANMSHEIRTPLNGIIGMTNILMEKKKNDTEIKDILSVIDDCGRQLLAIVEDILDLSKLQCGKLTLKNDLFNIVECIETTVSSQSLKAEEKKLILTHTCIGNFPKWYYGDDYRIKQIINNLVSNAIKFTPQGSITVSLNSEPTAKKDIWNVYISVRDTGIGIPQEKLTHIYKPFNQIDESYTRNTDGSGLGLSITKKLVELMNGNVNVESQMGKGTTFRIFIPLTADPLKHDDTITPKIDASPENMRDLRSKNALIIDDNENNRQIICHVLLQLGMFPFSCQTSKDLMTYVQSNMDISIIFLDVCMPETSGIELGKIIRDKRPDIPLVALSSVSQMPKSQPDVFKRIVTKPYKFDSIKQLCVELLCAKSRINLDVSDSRVRKDSAPNRSSLKFLVVEDNHSNQHVITAILKHLGYNHIDLAKNGLVCLDKVKDNIMKGQGLWDIIFIDLKMPVLNGFQTIQKLKDTYPGVTFHFVVLTASIVESDRKKCEDLGIMGYLVKPIRPNEVNDLINKIKSA